MNRTIFNTQLADFRAKGGSHFDTVRLNPDDFRDLIYSLAPGTASPLDFTQVFRVEGYRVVSDPTVTLGRVWPIPKHTVPDSLLMDVSMTIKSMQTNIRQTLLASYQQDLERLVDQVISEEMSASAIRTAVAREVREVVQQEARSKVFKVLGFRSELRTQIADLAQKELTKQLEEMARER